MGKIIRFSVFLCLLICFTLLLPGCGRKNEVPSQSNKQATINDVNYTSLTEAVDNAKSGDTIKIYNDLKDHKNVTISKPLTIKGIMTSSRIKPKFYGSITIDLNGEEDSATIENIEIIHDGVLDDGLNNDTRTGVNLIDGGLTLKSNIIGLDEGSTPDNDASGIIISRRAGSKNFMPIIVKGNRFNSYSTDSDQSSAMILKSNLDGTYQKLNLNENELYNQNTFNTKDQSDQFKSINYEQEPFVYSYFVTSSANQLINALMENQDSNGCHFYYYATEPLTEAPESPVTIYEETVVTIDGNNVADFKNTKFIVNGTFTSETDLSNTTLEKGSPLSSIMFGEDVKRTNVTIK